MVTQDVDEHQETHRIALTVAVLGAAVVAAVLADNRMIALGVIGIGLLVALTQSIRVLAGALVALVLIELPLQADIYLARDEAVAATSALSGYVMSLATLALAVLMAVWVAERAAGARQLVPASRISTSSWAYLAWVGLSTIWALDPTRSLQEAWVLGQAILLFAYLRNHVSTKQGVDRMRFLLIVALLVEGLFVMASAVLGEIVIGPIQSTIHGTRGGGTLGSPNALGAFVTMMLPLAMVGLRRDMTRLTQFVAWAAAGSGAVALILSSSRGAWVGSALAVGSIALIGLFRGWYSRITLAVLAAGGLVAIIAFGGRIASRVAAYDNAAAQARGPLNRLALQVINGDPWLGVGANNFSKASAAYLDVSFADAWISTVHNKYLLVWAETGIIGLALFLWFMWSVGSTAVRLGRRRAPFAPDALAVLAAFAGTSVHMLVDLFNGRVQYEMIWLMAAFLEAIRNVRTDAQPTPTGQAP